MKKLPSAEWMYRQMAAGHELSAHQKVLLRRTAELCSVHAGIERQIVEDGVPGSLPLIHTMVQLSKEIRINLSALFPEKEESGDEWLARLREGRKA